VVFAAELDGPAWVNVSGFDSKLLPVNSVPPCCLQEIGDRVLIRYRGEGIEVTIKAKVNWVCPPDPTDESCEVFRLKGKLVAMVGGERIVREVAGQCGC